MSSKSILCTSWIHILISPQNDLVIVDSSLCSCFGSSSYQMKSLVQTQCKSPAQHPFVFPNMNSPHLESISQLSEKLKVWTAKKKTKKKKRSKSALGCSLYFSALSAPFYLFLVRKVLPFSSIDSPSNWKEVHFLVSISCPPYGPFDLFHHLFLGLELDLSHLPISSKVSKASFHQIYRKLSMKRRPGLSSFLALNKSWLRLNPGSNLKSNRPEFESYKFWLTQQCAVEQHWLSILIEWQSRIDWLLTKAWLNLAAIRNASTNNSILINSIHWTKHKYPLTKHCNHETRERNVFTSKIQFP